MSARCSPWHISPIATSAPVGSAPSTVPQGAAANCVIAHVESFHADTDTRAAFSRARTGATIYTESRASLTNALGTRDGAQVGAVDETFGRERSTGIGITAPGIVAALGL